MSYFATTNSIIYKRPYKGIISIILIWSFLFSIMPIDFTYADGVAVPLSLKENKEQPAASTPQALAEAQKNAEAMIQQNNELLNATSELAPKTEEATNEQPQKLEAGQESVPGDTDGNGVIDNGDYMHWRAANDQQVYDPQVDFNADGKIDIQDYLIMAQSFYAQEGVTDRLIGDLNFDGVVDQNDIDMYQMFKDSHRGDDRYNPLIDLNFDDTVDGNDENILIDIVNGNEPTIPGDFDGNGHIDIGDYNVWQNANGSHPGDPNFNPAFDLNNDGSIDMNDYLIMAQSYYDQEGFQGQAVGDINNDGQFNILEAFTWREHQNSHRGDPQYVSTCDLNFDDFIDDQDKAILSDVLRHEGYISGNLNGDEYIDAQDYSIWQQANGAHPGDPAYSQSIDLNNDSIIDIADYLYIARDWYALHNYTQTPGDTNTNGQFDIGDFLTLQKALIENTPAWQVARCDLNFDGVFDQTDKALLISLMVYQGYSIENLRGDLTGDGVINVSDYDVWLAHKGARSGDALYDMRYDLNNDSVIDAADLYILVGSFYTELGYTQVSVTDFNHDGSRDYNDAVNFIASFGAVYGTVNYTALADLNLDGRISEADMFIWNEIYAYLGLGNIAPPNEISIAYDNGNLRLDSNRFVGYVYNAQNGVIGQYVIAQFPGDTETKYISIYFNDFYRTETDGNNNGLFALFKTETGLQYVGSAEEQDFEKILYKDFNGEQYAVVVAISRLINFPPDFVEVDSIQNLFDNNFFENASETLLESVGKTILDKAEGHPGYWEETVLRIFDSIFHINYRISLTIRERILRFTINSALFAVTLYQGIQPFALNFLIDYGLNRYGINQNNGYQMWVEPIAETLMNQIITAISNGFSNALGNPSIRQNYLQNISYNIKLTLECFSLSSNFYDSLANFLITFTSDIESRGSKQLLMELSLRALESGLLTRDRETAILNYLIPKLITLTFNDIAVFVRKAMNFNFSQYASNSLLPNIINLALSMPLTVNYYDITHMISYAVDLITTATNLNIFDALIAKVNPKLASETDRGYADRLSAIIAVFRNYKIIFHDLNGLTAIWSGLIHVVSELYSILPQPLQGLVHVISLRWLGGTSAYANSSIITLPWNDPNTWSDATQYSFRSVLIHETGHLFQFENPAELDAIFLRLYDDSISSSPMWWGSYDPDNFISWYAVTNYFEDFAENIATWAARDSLTYLYHAITLAQAGKPLMLEKYLFAMKYFRSQINSRDVLYLYDNNNTGFTRDTLPVRFDMFTGQIIFLNTGDKVIDFIYNSEGRLVEVRTRDLTPTERVLFAGDSDQNGSLNFPEWWDVRGRLCSSLGAVSGGTDPAHPVYIKELDFNKDGFIDSADATILNGLEPSSIYNVNASLFGASGNNSNIKIYAGGYIKITMPDGRVIRGKIGDYMTFQTNVYWKVTTRTDGSLDTFEIYQQQGPDKVLLAKRFYDTQNRIIADMTSTGGQIRVGLKDYATRSKTIFTISSVTPNDLLKDITLENISTYAQGEKVVYLYDSQQSFEDVPLFCMTDPQMFADKPVIVMHYQSDDNGMISSWSRWEDPTGGIFIINETADVFCLLTDIEGRTPENIDNLIMVGNDTFLVMGQMITVPSRSLYYDYNSSTGMLNFFDPNTGETIASVPYPEADRVMIDNEEYEITIENGILSLIPPILYEYSISLFGATGDNSSVKIYDNNRVKITMPDGRIIEGYLGDYMQADPIAYWKINIRDDGSIDTCEIYQQQGQDKVLLAKRFYDKENRIIADMTAAGGPIRIGIKDYENTTKTIFTIASNEPSQLLKDLNLYNINEYSQQEKVVYLYDATQNFEDVPLFCMTDPQMFADKPIVTLYYQSDDNKKINGWHYEGNPEGVFIVKDDADIVTLLTDPDSRTHEGIDKLIQDENDIFLMMGQTVILPQRSLWYDYNCSTSFLTFVDAATCEVVGSVKYPEESILIIDDKEYEIKIDGGILKLEGVFEPFGISASTTTDGNKNLTIAVDKDLNVVVTWYGQAYKGVFDIDSKTIAVTSSSNLGYEIKFEETQAGYSLESIAVTSISPYGKSTTIYKFSETALTNIIFNGLIKSSTGQLKYVDVANDPKENKIKWNGKEYLVSIDKTGMMQLSEIIALVNPPPFNYSPWTRMFLRQRRSLWNFLGRSGIEKKYDLLLY